MNLPRLYTEVEAATYLGITPRTLARLRRAEEIGHIVVADRRYRYTEAHLLQFLRDRARGKDASSRIVANSAHGASLHFPKPKRRIRT